MKFIWNNSNSFLSLKPITQVYGVCFDDSGRILIIKQQGKSWNIPGGTPKAGENPSQTLIRELDEEVDISIGKSEMIGYYEVVSSKPTIYQLRFVAMINELKVQTVDPATGVISERKLIKPNEFFNYVKIEDYRPMLNEAVKWFKKNKLLR